MKRLATLVMGSTLLAACATAPGDGARLGLAAEPVSSTAPAAAAAETATADGVVTVDIARLDGEPVCETQRRPGSRIGTTVCYTPEQRAALEREESEEARQYARDLDRERALKDQQGRQTGQQPSFIVFQ